MKIKKQSVQNFTKFISFIFFPKQSRYINYLIYHAFIMHEGWEKKLKFNKLKFEKRCKKN